MLSDLSCVDGLVVARLGKSYGERLDGRRRLGLHERGNQRGINPAGEERANRYIGKHSQADRITQEQLRAFNGLVHVASERILDATLHDRPSGPIRPRRGALAGRRYPEQVPRRQLVDALINRIRRGDIAESEEERKATTIQRAGEVRERAEGLELNADSPLQNQGLDSLKVMSLVFKIEEHYDVVLDEEDADDLRTVADLAALVLRCIEQQP